MDAGVEEGGGVGQAEVFAMFARNIERLKDMLVRTIAELPSDECRCASWADDIELPYTVPGR
jgi:5'-methylthioadenosine phosphorylase